MYRPLQRALKRGLDVTAAACGLLLISPLAAAAAAAILVAMGRPVLFRQLRSGRKGKAFTMIKFRTMTSACDAAGALRPDSERLTRLGRFLRKHSIDELPQLWNVLTGEMSLVGPRPLLPQYVGRYNAYQRRRLEVKPGITGWAQIQGRNSVDWESRLAYDVWYVDHWSIAVDLWILAATPVELVRQRGISADGHDTMPEFQGSIASVDLPREIVRSSPQGNA